MQTTRFYHFLLTKSEEEEQEKLHGDNPRPLNFDVVEIRSAGEDHPLKTLPLFPWEIKINLAVNNMGFFGPVELSPEQVYDHILKHWDARIVCNLISLGREQIPTVLQDLNTGVKHDICLIRSKEGVDDEEKYKIHLYWKQNNVEQKRDSLLIGMYWDIRSSCLCLSVLDSQ